jgi:hypothetical protein
MRFTMATWLGLIAVHKNDIETARRELLESGKTPGSPTLNSFGPNMILAKELLEKGARGGSAGVPLVLREFLENG